MTEEELFTPEKLREIQQFYDTYEPNFPLFERRIIQPEGPIRNLFYGDSITAGFPYRDFFPNHSILNRGIPGDNINGLYMRLPVDLYPFHPERVFLMAGINGIEKDEDEILESFHFVIDRIRAHGSQLILCSMTPLRAPDQWDRFQYQDKIVRINHALREWAKTNADGYIDYHSITCDESGQLAKEFARPDGTHLTIPCYVQMAKLLKPWLL